MKKIDYFLEIFLTKVQTDPELRAAADQAISELVSMNPLQRLSVLAKFKNALSKLGLSL